MHGVEREIGGDQLSAGVRWARTWLVAAIAAVLTLVAGPARAGMNQVMLESGPYQMSVDGAASWSQTSMTYTITRPTSTATVHRVFASVTSVWGLPDPGISCLRVGGIPVTLNSVAVDSTTTTRYDDVTLELEAYLNGLAVGPNVVPVDECRTAENDGNSLIVVWEDPTFPQAVVSVSLGSVLTGSDPSITVLTEPIDASATDFQLDVGIAISFSTGVGQVSEVDINGVTVATAAGGLDDGDGVVMNGGLYTMGGDGDGPNQEKYDGTALVADGDTQITVDLYGATFDDILTAIWVWAPGAVLDCTDDVDTDGDGAGDMCDVCQGWDDLVDTDLDTVADGCDVCPGWDDAVDTDLDGAIDGCDVCEGWDDAIDTDLDGAADGCDLCAGWDDAIDTDLDGAIDGCDICAGWNDTYDTDLDLIPDGCDACPIGPNDVDADADTVADACDSCPGSDDLADLDGDGVPNGCDAILFFLSPKRGPIAGGQTTLLVGTAFDPSCVATFDGVAAPTTYLDGSTLSAEPPAHAEGLVDVAAICAWNTATLVGGYTYFDESVETGVPPELFTVDPYEVDVAGGQTVIATGEGFVDGAVVEVDGVQVSANVLDPTRVSFDTPPHAEGLAPITIVNPDGLADRLDGALLYVAAADVPEPPAPEEEQAAEGKIGGSCSTTPGVGPGMAASLLIALVMRRRGVVLLAAAAGCSEYHIESQPDEKTPPPPGAPPIAITGPAVQVPRDTPATLDASASYDPDPDGTVVSWAWEITGQPDGADAALSDPTASAPTLTADTLGSYFVSLVVTDADGLESVNPAAQVVEVVPWEDLELSLTWFEPVDLDLHLLAPDGAYYGTEDCFFGNPAPDWGAPGVVTDDPLLSVDEDGSGPGPAYGPETILLPAPTEATYSVVVVYWNDRGAPAVPAATLSVWAAGQLVVERPVPLQQVGDAVIVGSLDWPTLAWTDDGTATTHDALGGPPINE